MDETNPEMSDTKLECCNVPVELRAWLIRLLAEHVGDQVHYQRVPDFGGKQGPCALPRPYVWFSRADTETEECLEYANSELLQLAGFATQDDTASDTEFFDVEIWSQDPFEVECCSYLLRRGSPYQPPAGEQHHMWFRDLKVVNQADDYFARGIKNSYADGGATVASVQIEVCPLCVPVKTSAAKPPWWQILKPTRKRRV